MQIPILLFILDCCAPSKHAVMSTPTPLVFWWDKLDVYKLFQSGSLLFFFCQ